MINNLIDYAKRQIYVCFVSLDVYPLFNTRAVSVQGGSEVDFYMLATELAIDNRFRVSIVTGDFGQPEVEIAGDITIYKAADLRKKPISGVPALWKAMRRADADIYFKKGPSLTTDLVALFCRLNHKIFFFRTAHDLDCDGTYLKQYPLRGKFYLWSLRQAKRVFVQKAADLPNLLHTAGINAIMIPNGHRIIDTPAIARDFILWVGRSEEFKQPRLFIELAKEIPSEQFVMICQQTKGDLQYDRLLNQAVDVKNLEFIESVPFHEIKHYFSRAKIFVCSSRAEGFPNTFIQAGICATPILSLTVNPDGLLDKYNCGVCCSGDAAKLLESLKSFLSQPRLLAEMGQNAKNYVSQYHDVAKIIEEYKRHFIEVAPKTSG